MFYSFIRDENINNIFYISNYFLDYKIGIYLIFISICLTILKHYISKLNNNDFIIFFIFSFGIYVSTFYSYDETFINLEHIYNLNNFGKLSFSPYEMINGTVDYVFCFLLYPFSASRDTLLIANYILNFVFLFLHFVILFFYFKNKTNIRYLLLILFACYLPFTWIFGKGFGNNIVSLFFFYSLILYLENKTNKSLLVASFLPILRPDAILYSMTILIGHFLNTKEFQFRYFIFSLISFFAFFVFTYIVYNQVIPTPMEFKSISIKELDLIDYEAALKNILKSYNLFFLICFLFSLFFIEKKSEIVKINYFFLPLFAIFLFYSLNPETQSFPRYSFGFLLLQAIFFIFLISKMELNIKFNEKLFFNLKLNFLFKYETYISVLIMITIIPILIHTQNTRFSGNRIDTLSIGGQITEKIIPNNWVVAATELNTFGFSNDLNIYDMWGYSNKLISKSKIRTDHNKKIIPELFLKISPDIFWFRTRNINGMNYYVTKANPEYTLTQANFSKSENYLGDMNKILNNYDLYSLIYKNYDTILLVRKDNKEKIFKYLAKNKFQIDYKKELDFKEFKFLYEISKYKSF